MTEVGSQIDAEKEKALGLFKKILPEYPDLNMAISNLENKGFQVTGYAYGYDVLMDIFKPGSPNFLDPRREIVLEVATASENEISTPVLSLRLNGRGSATGWSVII